MTRMAIVLASVLMASSAWATTDKEFLEKTVGKYLSADPTVPKKGLCICLSDNAPGAAKRIGVLTMGELTSGDTYVAVVCRLLPFDATGARVVGPQPLCSDWIPLSK